MVPSEGHTVLKWQLKAKNASVDFVCALVAVSHEKYYIFIDFKFRTSLHVSDWSHSVRWGESHNGGRRKRGALLRLLHQRELSALSLTLTC